MFKFQVLSLEFEWRKLSYNIGGTDGIQKDLKKTDCIEMECKDDVGMLEATTQEVLTKESISGLEVVKLIVAELRRNGRLFILPMNDITAMEAVTKAFKLLLDIGKLDQFFCF